MKLLRVAGATSEIWQVFIRDSSSTTGAGLTGLAHNSGSLTAYYHRDTDTTATAISLVTMTVGTFTSSGFKEIDSTNMPGWYQFCPPNAALASGAKSCSFHLKGASNMAPLPIEVDLDPQGDVRWYGGTAGTFSSGRPEVNATHLGGTSQTGRDIGASVLLSSGTGTGQVKLSSGYVAPNWGDVGNPTTTNNLSGTTVKTATDVETDTQDIQSRIPAALGANGNIKADVRDYGGTAGTFSGGRPEVNTTLIEGSDATNQIRDSVVDDATRIDASALNTLSGHDPGETIMGATDSVTVGTNNDKTGYGLANNAITAAATAADFSTEVNAAVLAKLLAYFQLLMRKDAAIATDNAAELTDINADEGSGAGSFANTTDSTQAIRDRGDAAWVTGEGGGGGGDTTCPTFGKIPR